MIFYSRTDRCPLLWKPLPVGIKLRAISFAKMVYKIDKKVYYAKTPKFIEEFKKARAWELLSR